MALVEQMGEATAAQIARRLQITVQAANARLHPLARSGHLSARRLETQGRPVAYTVARPLTVQEAEGLHAQQEQGARATAALLAYMAEPRTVRELAEHLGTTRAAATARMGWLSKRGLVHRVKRGVWRATWKPAPQA